MNRHNYSALVVSLLICVVLSIVVLDDIVIYLPFVRTSLPPTATLSPQEQNCVDSGGVVETASCCLTTGDFPQRCMPGACSCAPEYSHEVKVCSCGPGRCFNGVHCVASEGFMIEGTVYESAASMEQPIPGAAVYIRGQENPTRFTAVGCDEQGRYRLFVTGAHLAEPALVLGAHKDAFARSTEVISVSDLISQPERNIELGLPTPTPTPGPNPTATPPCATVYQGQVVNVDTQQPIEGALVSQNSVETLTDETGHYELVFPFCYTLSSVFADGYREVVARLYDNACLHGEVNFQLAPTDVLTSAFH